MLAKVLMNIFWGGGMEDMADSVWAFTPGSQGAKSDIDLTYR